MPTISSRNRNQHTLVPTLAGSTISGRALALLLAGLLFACPGCFFSRAKRHAPIDAAMLEKIEVGVSTIDDVVELLGAPTDILFSSRDHDPLRVFALEYTYEVTKSTGFSIIVLTFLNSDAKRDHVLIFFDDDGRVEAVGSSLNAERARYGLPFSSEKAPSAKGSDTVQGSDSAGKAPATSESGS